MDDIKNIILDKAKERAERFGYKKTTMDEISKDCRISKKTIYEHFTDKEELFRSLVMRECQRVTEMLFAQIADINDPVEKLTHLIHNAVAYFSQDNFIVKILRDDKVDLLLKEKGYREIIDKEVIALIADIIRDGKARGSFRDVDEELTAYAGFKLFLAFTVERPDFLRSQDEGYYAAILTDFIVNGIAK